MRSREPTAQRPWPGIAPAGLAGPPRTVPPGSRCLAREGEARASRGDRPRSQRPARGCGSTRGPSAWVRRTAASAVRGAAPPGPQPGAHAPTHAGQHQRPDPQCQAQTPTGRGGGAGISGPLLGALPCSARGGEDPWAPRLSWELRPGGALAESRPRQAGAVRLQAEVRARCQAAARLGCGGVGSALRSHGLFPPQRPRRAGSARAGNPTRLPQPLTPHGRDGGGEGWGRGEEWGGG